MGKHTKYQFPSQRSIALEEFDTIRSYKLRFRVKPWEELAKFAVVLGIILFILGLSMV